MNSLALHIEELVDAEMTLSAANRKVASLDRALARWRGVRILPPVRRPMGAIWLDGKNWMEQTKAGPWELTTIETECECDDGIDRTLTIGFRYIRGELEPVLCLSVPIVLTAGPSDADLWGAWSMIEEEAREMLAAMGLAP